MVKIQVVEPKIGVRAKKIKARTYAIWDEENNFSVYEAAKPLKEAQVRERIVNLYKQDVFKNQKLHEKCVKEFVGNPIMQILSKFIERNK